MFAFQLYSIVEHRRLFCVLFGGVLFGSVGSGVSGPEEIKDLGRFWPLRPAASKPGGGVVEWVVDSCMPHVFA
jgi:hypothetical protein